MNTPIALVTGASRGIGRAIAVRLAERGVRVAVHYRSDRAAAASALAALPGEGHALFAANLADPQAVVSLWGEVQQTMGLVDILVNNAGIYTMHPPLVTEFAAWDQAWQETLATNLLGPANLSVLAVRSMSERGLVRDRHFGRGRIVNISSRGAFRGEPDAPAYGASKAGLNALSQSLAKAVALQEIYVYCIAPGWVETEMARAHLSGPDGVAILAQHPLGRVNGADEIANASVYCALDAPGAMTGSIIDVNGASYLRT
jgi:NAD(P)-dependent dehydrogenase (short-subunit alcohol dehydrogenase family)